MCTAASWATKAEKFRSQFPFLKEDVLPDYQRRLIRPTDPMVVMRSNAEDSAAERLCLRPFGLMNPAHPDGRPHINARSENLERLVLWRELFESRRCVVFIDGFYEARPGHPQEKYRFAHRDTDGRDLPLALAALWGENGVAVITRSALEPVASVHDRQPVVLPPEHVEAWIAETKAGARRLLAQPPPGICRTRIDPDAYRVGREDPNAEILVQPWSPATEQQVLF